MFNIRQERLFSLEEILETSPRESYSLILGSLDINPLLEVVSKKAIFGAPEYYEIPEPPNLLK